MDLGQGHRHTLEQTLDTRLRFSRPLECDIHELLSVLDCYSADPQGFWPGSKPKLQAPLSHYQNCKQTLDQLWKEGERYTTVGEYLLSTVDTSVRRYLKKVLV